MKTRATLITLAVGALLAALYHYESWRLQSRQHLAVVAKAADLDRSLSQYSVLPSILASDPRLVAALLSRTAQTTQTANEALQLAASRSDAAFVFLMNDSGTTIASSNYNSEVSFVGRDYSFRPYFTRAMNGSSASFFAVGATTGIPGYFVSEPVNRNGKIIGVVVVKMEPAVLPLAWKDYQSTTILGDDFGVPILSTDNSLLYVAPRTLSPEQAESVIDERRYTLRAGASIEVVKPGIWKVTENGEASTFSVSSADLVVEPWTLSLLSPVRSIYIATAIKVGLLTGLSLLLFTLWKIYRQQQLLAQERAARAKELELQVAQRTQQLQDAQAASIAESNFTMLGKMSAAINHEVNQPLASMRFNLATLRQLIERADLSKRAAPAGNRVEPELEGDDIQTTVVELDRTAKRIARVIETFRALPQQSKASFVALDANSILLDCIDTIKTERKQMSACLSADIPRHGESLGYVNGNRVLLQQAILNLLYNALDALTTAAATAEPYADIIASSRDRILTIAVRDNGAGLKPHEQTVLFEPFQSSSEKSAGLGLGLTLARQIIDNHGGTISHRRQSCEVQSTTMELTVFTITLPTIERPPDV